MGTARSETQTTEDSSTAAMLLNVFLGIENGNSIVTQSVNRVAQSASKILEGIVRVLSQGWQNSKFQSTQVQLGSKNNNDMKRWRSLSNDSRNSLRSVRFQSPQQRGKTNFCRSDNHIRDNGSNSKLNKRNENDSNKSACKNCKSSNNDSKGCKACLKCLKPGHFRGDCTTEKPDSVNEKSLYPRVAAQTRPPR